MKHKIGIFNLTMIGLSGVIGSGWLLASMYAAQKAGTGSLLAWVLGAILMFFFCMCLSELISLYPKRGLLASVCSFSHNKDFAFIIGIANWFGTVAVIPAEALATVRYLNWPHRTVILLILMYAALNSCGVKLFSKFNSTITAFKFIVPALTVIVLLTQGINPHNFHLHQLTNLHGIVNAAIAGGVIYGFNGVQMIVNFTGEAKKSSRDIPIAMFLSLAIGLILYLALQVSFLGAANLSTLYNSPFIELAVALNMGWLVILLQADAAVSPSGTGFSFMASTTRMLTAMSREGQLPSGFNILHPKYNISHRSLIGNTILALILFGVFKTWIGLVLVVSTFHVVSYLAGPLAVGKLRITMPNKERSFSLPLYWLICPLLFIALSILFVFAGYSNDFAITAICVGFQALYLILNYKGIALIKAINRSAFLPVWLIVFTTLSHVKINVSEIALIALFLYYVGIGR